MPVMGVRRRGNTPTRKGARWISVVIPAILTVFILNHETGKEEECNDTIENCVHMVMQKLNQGGTDGKENSVPSNDRLA